jgi:hypothetical protein
MGDGVIGKRADLFVGEAVRIAGEESCFAIGDHVRMTSQSYDDATTGVVTGIYVTSGGFLYAVTWGDTREERRHWHVELIEVD